MQVHLLREMNLYYFLRYSLGFQSTTEPMLTEPMLEYDETVWGHDRPFFAEETLYY